MIVSNFREKDKIPICLAHNRDNTQNQDCLTDIMYSEDRSQENR